MRYIAVLFTFLLSGCASQNTGNVQPAECCQQEVMDTDAARTRIALGLTYLNNGDYSRAKTNLDKALEFAPYMADSHYSLSYYFKVIGENERANELYASAQRLERLKPDIANSYGAYLCQQNRYQEAKSYFKQAIKNLNKTNSVETYENIALCAAKAGYTNDAIEYLHSALKHQPERIKTLTLLAELYTAQGKFEQAEEVFERMEKSGPVDDNLLWLRMDNARQQSDFKKMQDYGNILLEIYPHSPLAKSYVRAKGELMASNKLKPAQEIAPELSKIQQYSAPAPISGLATNARDNEPEKAVALAASDKEMIEQATTVPEAPIKATGNAKKPLFHIVKRKQNLYRISRLYNITIARLMELNKLEDASNITTGMKLWLVPEDLRH
jgi:type IV pilus assembly protein PilF